MQRNKKDNICYQKNTGIEINHLDNFDYLLLITIVFI